MGVSENDIILAISTVASPGAKRAGDGTGPREGAAFNGGCVEWLR